MKYSWIFLLLVFEAWGQQQLNGRNYAVNFNGRDYSPVIFDSAASVGNLNVTKFFTCSPVAGASNVACVLLTSENSTTSETVQSVSGCGGTWYKFGATFAGNGTMKNGEVWYDNTTNVTGACTVTATWTAAQSVGGGGIMYTLHGVSSWTPVYSSTSALSGGLTITMTRNDLAISANADSAINQTVSGCTTATEASLSTSNFHMMGAHCLINPTATFTWAAFGTNSLATGINVSNWRGR